MVSRQYLQIASVACSFVFCAAGCAARPGDEVPGGQEKSSARPSFGELSASDFRNALVGVAELHSLYCGSLRDVMTKYVEEKAFLSFRRGESQEREKPLTSPDFSEDEADDQTARLVTAELKKRLSEIAFAPSQQLDPVNDWDIEVEYDPQHKTSYRDRFDLRRDGYSESVSIELRPKLTQVSSQSWAQALKLSLSFGRVVDRQEDRYSSDAKKLASERVVFDGRETARWFTVEQRVSDTMSQSICTPALVGAGLDDASSGTSLDATLDHWVRTWETYRASRQNFCANEAKIVNVFQRAVLDKRAIDAARIAARQAKTSMAGTSEGIVDLDAAEHQGVRESILAHLAPLNRRGLVPDDFALNDVELSWHSVGGSDVKIDVLVRPYSDAPAFGVSLGAGFSDKGYDPYPNSRWALQVIVDAHAQPFGTWRAYEWCPTQADLARPE